MSDQSQRPPQDPQHDPDRGSAPASQHDAQHGAPSAGTRAQASADQNGDGRGGKHGGARPGRKALKILMWVLLALVLVVVAAIIFIMTFDWNRARPWINRKVSAAIERPFAINGNLAVDWRRPGAPEAGWRRFIPWPHITANDITLGDPAAFSAPGKDGKALQRTAMTAAQRASLRSIPASASDTAHVRRMTMALDPLPLLDKRVHIPSLALSQAKLRLERTADGRVNWTLPEKKDERKWQVDIRQFVLTNGTVHLVDAIRHADIVADVDTIPKPEAGRKGQPYGIRWTVGGTVNDEKLTGDGMAGAILSLQQGADPYPIKAQMATGSSRLKIEGTVGRMRDAADIDLQMSMSGNSMGELYALTGILLPATPPYSTAGHLTGSLRRRNALWKYERFTGKVGGSDIGGTIELHRGGPRPLIKGKLVTDTLVFADLAPVVGADSNEAKRKRGAEPQPPGKVLPYERFQTERWRKMDADVTYTVRNIVRETKLPISRLSADIELKDGVLSLTPLSFGVAGGTLDSNIRLDGRGDTIKADVKTTARGLALQHLFPTPKSMEDSFGTVNGSAALSGTGNSIAALLGSSSGEVKASIGTGSLSKLLLELAGLNLGNVLLTKLSGDRRIQLNCAAADFAVNKGLMQTRLAVIDTREAVIRATGTINLATEQLNLDVRPSTKGLRIFTLRTPFFVRGTFKDPKPGVNTGALALKAGAAVALASAAPAAALIPLINPGTPKQPECGGVATARGKADAPPGQALAPGEAAGSGRTGERAGPRTSESGVGRRADGSGKAR